MNANKIPPCLRERPQWILWKIVTRDGKETKLPYQVNGEPAKSNDAATWTGFDEAHKRLLKGGYSGVGFVFAESDPFCGIDLDGCRSVETGTVAPWAKVILAALDSYSEVSPSQTGVKIFCRAKLPFATGRKVELKEFPVCDKTPAIEVYDHLRYFAVTGLRLGGIAFDCEPRQDQVEALCKQFWPDAPTGSGPAQDWHSDDAVVERARKYLAKMPAAVSGQSGHNAAFHAACVLVCGFGLGSGQALMLMREYNQVCKPPWSERELAHKVEQAAKQPGPRNYLRLSKPENFEKVAVPEYRERTATEKTKREPSVSTLENAARKYLDVVRSGNSAPLELGLPDVDYAIGGGVEFGEMVIFAARPSHGKSLVALQSLHNATLNGLPSVMVSEEMSELAIGKRVIQFASDVPQEHWQTSTVEVNRHITEHFEERAKCFLVESCGNVETAAEVIRKHVQSDGVKFAAVDYAQLLAGVGKSRYEQITNTSIVLRQLATECKIVLVVLCQLNRAIESRSKFTPIMADIKETGQLEQDADVILFLVWPHRIDQKNDPHKYQFYVAKNRNRPINQGFVECEFRPSRQMLLVDPAKHRDPFDGHATGGSNFNPDAWADKQQEAF